MDFHWEQGSGVRSSEWLVLEEGFGWSAELPPNGAIAHVAQLPVPDYPYQLSWLGAASSVKDSVDRPSETFATEDVAIAAAEATVRAAGHTVNGG